MVTPGKTESSSGGIDLGVMRGLAQGHMGKANPLAFPSS